MRAIYSLIGTLALVGTAHAAELRGSPEELKDYLHPAKQWVTLYAEAEEKAFTDNAIVSVVVTTKEKTLASSMEKNSQLRQSLIANLVQTGIAPSAINNAKFASSPQYGWFGKKPSSYEVVNRVVIKIDTEKQLKAIATQVDGHDEISLLSTEFEHSKADEFTQSVKAKALDKVLAQKAVYEQKLGVKLVAVNFRESSIRPMATAAAYGTEQLQMRMADNELSSAPMLKKAGEAEPHNSFDEIKYTANMSVDFEVNR